MRTLTDDSLMPFGEHKDKQMVDVPAKYLMWLWEQNEDKDESLLSPNTAAVLQYIDKNWDGIAQEIGDRYEEKYEEEY